MSVSTLIRCGHANAWDYPLGVFIAATDELKEAGNGNGSDS